MATCTKACSKIVAFARDFFFLTHAVANMLALNAYHLLTLGHVCKEKRANRSWNGRIVKGEDKTTQTAESRDICRIYAKKRGKASNSAIYDSKNGYGSFSGDPDVWNV